MKKYFYNCPRGFANEFSIISVEQSNAREVKAMETYFATHEKSNNIDWDLHRINAKKAQEITRRERQTARMYRKAGLNLSNNPVGAMEIITATEFFRYAE